MKNRDIIFILPDIHFYANINFLRLTNLYDFPNMIDQEELQAKLTEYQVEHKALDEMLDAALNSDQPINLLHMQQLKKKKLWLKDMIQKIESDLLPDIIA